MRMISVVLVVLSCAAAVWVSTDQEQLMRDRQERRAFYTAPPTISHAVNEDEWQDCMDCHSEHTDMGDGRISNQSPHKGMSHCLQCHAPETPFFGDVPDSAGNTFTGLEAPDVMQSSGPPIMPHRLFLREHCETCHSMDHPVEALRVDHLHQTQCFTCHGTVEKEAFEN